jgi:hypothetical protein
MRWLARSTPLPSASFSSANRPASIRLASSTSCPALSSGTFAEPKMRIVVHGAKVHGFLNVND